MKFPDDRMTITQVIPHLWQGAMPMPGSDMAEYGVGVRVYLLRAEVPARAVFARRMADVERAAG